MCRVLGGQLPGVAEEGEEEEGVRAYAERPWNPSLAEVYRLEASVFTR